MKLIRSKGVGVYFVTQNPLDVPDGVLAQLGNRVQHALRAYTPREQKAVKTAAETFRPNPDFDAMETITNLGVGEALVSTLADKGVPSIVQRTLIRPPQSRLGPLTDAGACAACDRPRRSPDSTTNRSTGSSPSRSSPNAPRNRRKQRPSRSGWKPRRRRAKRRPRKEARASRPTRSSNRQSVGEAAMKSVARSVATQLGRALVRGILGSFKRGR